MAYDIQDRLVFSLTDSQSTVMIHFSQRSDSGTYELVVSPDDLNLAALKDKVKISVKCKWNFFSLIFTCCLNCMALSLIKNMLFHF